VRDHAEALWQVLIRGKNGETYNIGGHNEWANIRIVELICDLIDEFAPQLGGSTRKLIAFVKDRPGHDRRYAIDASKIQRELDGCRRTRSKKAYARPFAGIWTIKPGSKRCSPGPPFEPLERPDQRNVPTPFP